MSIVRRLSRLSRTVQFALIAVAAFAIGSATVAAASVGGIPIGTLFYLTMLNGSPTTPCSSSPGTLGPTTTCTAVVDSNGNLHVAGTSTVSGTVGVNNFPGDQQVHGTVGVSNFPGDQQVHGSVGVNNFPTDQQVHGAVTGHVNVDNLPSSQTVNGTVNVGNLPTDTSGNVKVNVVAGGGGGGLPVATKSVRLNGQLDSIVGTHPYVEIPLAITATYIQIVGCDEYWINLSGGGYLDFQSQGNYAFPIPMSVTGISIFNKAFTGCSYDTRVIGY